MTFVNHKITRRKTLEQWANCYSSGSVHVIHGRAFTDDSRYLPFKFLVFVDDEIDLWDCETEREIPRTEYVEEAIGAMMDILYSSGSERFIEACNGTINHYNETHCYMASHRI